MKALVLGASGATGHKVVLQLLVQNIQVKAVLRQASELPQHILKHPNLEVIRCELLSLSDTQLQNLVSDCEIVTSCLGHNLTLKGMFAAPRHFVTLSIKRVCEAITTNQSSTATKLVLMSSSGVRNDKNNEKVSFAHNIVIHLLRWLVPPHKDNELATDFLQNTVGQKNRFIDWVTVRPDALIISNSVTQYNSQVSPVRDPIFNSGKTSRINVAHFMVSLVTDLDLWKQWKFQTPVIYDGEE